VPELQIRFQQTPNPNAGKFVLNRDVVSGDRSSSYSSVEEAEGDPLGVALMGLEGVTNVFMVEDFVTVTKTPELDWQELVPRVEETIRTVYGSDSPAS